MQTICWLITVFFLAGYLALEGFDFGVGMLLVRGDGARRDELARTISPLFLANEVWLVAAVGLLIGAFPTIEATQTPRLYPLIVLILICWLVRDAGLWFRARSSRTLWDPAIAVSSAGLAFGWGFILTDIAAGGQGIARLLPILGGLAAIGLTLLHGYAFRHGKPALLTGGIIAIAAAAMLLPNQPPAAGSATLNLIVAFVLPVLPFLIAVQVWFWRTQSAGSTRFFS